MSTAVTGLAYESAGPTWANRYLWPVVMNVLKAEVPGGAAVFDLGCGSGATAAMLAASGYRVTGVDPSEAGIALARRAYPHVRFEERTAYDSLSVEFGTFDAVVSLEVIEHCYWPRRFADTILGLLKPGGVAVISTPFHGYWKNLALALSNKFDDHFTALWDGGHIKFWSERTLRAVLTERGFTGVTFRRAGRWAPVAKSMIAVCRKAA